MKKNKSYAEKFSFAMCEMAWTSCKIPAKIYTKLHVQENDVRIHPTQKPVKLYEWLLKNYAKPTDKILDTHFGSLSIGIACHDLHFDLTACELDAEYYEKAKQRLIWHQKN